MKLIGVLLSCVLIHGTLDYDANSNKHKPRHLLGVVLYTKELFLLQSCCEYKMNFLLFAYTNQNEKAVR
jgi:hypothetical protein